MTRRSMFRDGHTGEVGRRMMAQTANAMRAAHVEAEFRKAMLDSVLHGRAEVEFVNGEPRRLPPGQRRLPPDPPGMP